MDGETEAELSENGEPWVSGSMGRVEWRGQHSPKGNQGLGNFLSHFFSVTFIWRPRRNQRRHILETSFSCRELSISQYIWKERKRGRRASERNSGVSCVVISTGFSSPS